MNRSTPYAPARRSAPRRRYAVALGLLLWLALSCGDSGTELDIVLALQRATVSLGGTAGGANPADATIDVTASGADVTGLRATTAYASGEPTGWLSASFARSSTPTTLTLRANIAGLSAGTYTATVRVSATETGDESVSLGVTLTLQPPPPTLSLPSTPLEFAAERGGVDPPAGTVMVQNSGTGTLEGISLGAVTFGAGEQGGWLPTPRLSGSTGAPTITLRPVTGALAAGTYHAQVAVVAANAANSPQHVQVTFTVTQPVPAGLAVVTQPAGAVYGAPFTTQPVLRLVGSNGQAAAGAGVKVAAQVESGAGTLGPQPALEATTDASGVATFTGLSVTGGGAHALRFTAPGLTPVVSQPFHVTFPRVIDVATTTVDLATFEGGPPSAPVTVQILDGSGAGLTDLAVGAVDYAAGQPGGWLVEAGLDGPTAPATLTLRASPAGLSAGAYTATVSIEAPGAAARLIEVSHVVGQGPSIAPSPTSLEFAAVGGGPSPAPQLLQVTNSGGGALTDVSVGAIVYGSGEPTGWLTASPDGTTAPVTIEVSATTGVLDAGSYSAIIEIGSPVASNTPMQVGVSFEVGAPQIIDASPSPATFLGSIGGTVFPPSRSVTISNVGSGQLSGLALGQVSYGPGASGWLEPPTLSGSVAPAGVTLSVDASALPLQIAEGVYTATVPVTSTLYGVAPGAILVELTVTVAEQICLSPAQVDFRAHIAGTDPAPVTVTATGCSGGSVPVALGAITYGNGEPTGWLGATLGTGGEVELGAALGTLPLGTYSASVQITSSDPAVLPIDLPVSFEVDAAQQEIGAQPASTAFQGVAGAADPAAATVSVVNASGLGTLTGLSVAAISYAQGASGWLAAALDGAVAPATLTLTPTSVGLVGGIYGAEVSIASSLAGVDTLRYPVTLTLQDPPSIVPTPTALAFLATEYRADPPAQQVAVSNGGDLPLTGLYVESIFAAGGGPAPWLGAALDVPDAPATLSVQAAIAGLAPGTYEATVRLASSLSGVAAADVVVSLVVAPGDPPEIELSSGAAVFDALVNGSDPLPGMITVTNGGDVPLTGLYLEGVTYGAGPTGWLTAFLFGSSAPSDLAIYASPAGLPAGTYQATVTVGSALAGVASGAIPVTFRVTSPPVLTSSSSSVSFAATEGGSDPAAILVDVTATGATAGLTATVLHGDPSTPWLSASIGPTTPATLTLEAAVAGLAAGFYTASVRVESTTPGVGELYVSASLVVGSPVAPRAIVLSPASFGVSANILTIPTDQYVTVLSSSGGAIHGLTAGPVTVGGQPATWVDASLSSTSTPATLTIDFVNPPPTIGPHALTIPVGSSEPGVGTQSLTISLFAGDGSFDRPGALLPSRLDLRFTGHVNGYADGPATIFLTNAGERPVDDVQRSIAYTGGDVGWLQAALSGSTLPTDLQVGVDYSVLSPGLHTAALTVGGQTSDVTGYVFPTQVTIDVEVFLSDAQIDVDPTSVDIQPYPIAGSTTPVTHHEPVRITNTGAQALTGLTVTGSGFAPWLTPALSSTSAPALLHLTGDPTGLSIGRYTETLALGFDHNPDVTYVDVDFRVFGFEVYPDAVAMSAQDGYAPDVDVAIQFEGNDPMLGGITYAAGEPAGWLDAQPTCPFFGCPSGQTFLTLQAEPDALLEGTYHAQVRVDGANPGVPSRTIDVTLTVLPPTIPVIAVSTHAVTFSPPSVGVSPPPVAVDVTNTGTGTITDLNLGGSTIPSWLTATFDALSTPTVLRLAADVTGLSPGYYFTTLYVGGDGAAEYQQIDVVLQVPVVPQISLSPDLLEFSAQGGAANPSSKTTLVTATAVGGVPAPLTGLQVESISYAAGQPTGWVTYALSSTTAPATLRIQPITGNLPEGLHVATVALASPVAGNSPRTVEVRFDVGPPDLAVSANTVTLTAYSQQTPFVDVDVTTGGAVVDDLTLSAPVYASGSGWLAATLSGGTSTPSRVRLTASMGALAAGTYQASVEVASATSQNSPQRIDVTFHVVPGIGVGQPSVSFPLTSPAPGTSTLEQTVAITNIGAGSLTGLTASVSAGAPWLQATLDQATAPATLTLRVTAGSLAPGTRTATVTIASPVAGNAPQTVGVWYFIATSFGQHVSPLISGTTCQGCHTGNPGSNPPNLTPVSNDPSVLHGRLVGVATVCGNGGRQYVVPGRPDLSELLTRVGPGPYTCGNGVVSPTFMPPGSTYPNNLVRWQTIDAWIREGAPDN